MADEDTGDELIVLDEADKPQQVEEPVNPVDQFKEQLEALKKDNEARKASEAAANRRAADLQAAAEQARQEVASVRTALVDRESDAIESRISAAQAEAEAAKAEYAAAAEAGDFKKQAEALSKISRAEAKVDRFEATKAEVALRKSNEETRPSRIQQVSSDPFEDHLTKFTPRTADWMREHKDWVTDQRKSSRLVSAHHVAIAAGHDPDTDEYFSHVEKTLGIGQPKPEPFVTPQPTRTRSAPMVAPVNGNAGGHSSGAGESRPANSIVLTKGEKDRATDGSLVWNRGERDGKGDVLKDGDPRIGKPIGIQEMGRRKLQLERGGYYDKSYSHG